MIRVVKKSGKHIKAYRLEQGRQCPAVEALIREGKIRPQADGSFEVLSQEAVQGGSNVGQRAQAGDYIKVDSAGFPYPNDAAYFAQNHRALGGDEYEQIPQPLDAWTADQPMCSEVAFLMQKKELVLHEEAPDHYFTAPLWGTLEAAAHNAVLVFYSIDRAPDGRITDASFNFVERTEFDKTYDILP